MEMSSSIRARRSRETSPERLHRLSSRHFRKVQIIYYLCRHGQLEHPHFMEVTHLPNQQLRLKDVMDRMTLLRGRGMPSLYSWSCKRSYKNGYVWNDLAENDVIYPAEGAEYILKGSEIIKDQLEHLHLSGRRIRNPTQAAIKPHHSNHHHHYHLHDTDEEEEEDGGAEQEEEVEVEVKGPQQQTSSSTASESAENQGPLTRTPSVLLQLIACGSVTPKGRGPGVTAFSTPSTPSNSGRKSGVRLLHRRGEEAGEEAGEEEEQKQVEEKYFTGSIVETPGVATQAPSLEKSSPYNEEICSSRRFGVGGIGAVENGEEDEKIAERSVRGRCIPSRKRSGFKLQLQQQLQPRK